MMEYGGWNLSWSGWEPDQAVVGDLVGWWTAEKGERQIKRMAAAISGEGLPAYQEARKEEARIELLAELRAPAILQ